jgi:DNA-binding beta-propeller fold protein YncE
MSPAAVAMMILLKTIPLGGEGRWDYICVDSAAQRVYVPRSSHVQILDLATDKVIGDVPGTRGVHGVALVLEQNLGFTSNGQDNSTSAFDLKTFKVVKSIKTGRNPDSITYDPASKHILTSDHSGGSVTAVDPADLDKAPVTITVGGTLETIVADGEGHAFVNVEDKNEVVQIDTKANSVLAHWPLVQGRGPTGLAIDVKRHLLFAGCGNQRMIVMDSQTGKVIAAVAIGRGVDGVAYEPTLEAAVSANGQDGTVSVVKETSPGKFEAVDTVKTVTGARTINVDTNKHQFLLPCNLPEGKGFGLAVVGIKEAK